jgi:hypothetical protein
MIDLRREIEVGMGMGGMPGFTCKIGIGGQDIYLKVVLHRPSHGNPPGGSECMLVHVDVTLSSPPRSTDDVLMTHRQARIETSKTDDARAMIELLCRQANVLLQSGIWDWTDLCDAWAGTHFDPCGVCAFPGTCSMEGAVVRSPLDAVSRVIRERFHDWEDWMARTSVSP